MNDNDDDDDNFNRRNIIQFYNCFDFSMLLLCVSAHTHHVYKCVFFFLTWNSDVDNFKTVWQMWIRLCVMCCVVQRVRVEINNVKMKSVTKCGEKLKICYSCNCVLWRRWWCVLIIVSMNKVNRNDIDMRKKMFMLKPEFQHERELPLKIQLTTQFL